jgi:hypothetical protein
MTDETSLCQITWLKCDKRNVPLSYLLVYPNSTFYVIIRVVCMHFVRNVGEDGLVYEGKTSKEDI